MTAPVFIIAEAGVNHNGDINTAFALIDAAQRAGADAVKFQTFKTEKIITKSAATADYQKNNVAGEASQFELVKRLELSYEQFSELQRHCKKRRILFLSTPDESESLDFLIDVLQIPIIKIGSGEVNNLPYLRQIASKNKPMILSTGMSYLGEIETAVATIQAISSAPITLLHCTTNYPCPMEQVNLSAMLTLKNAFKTEIGYSDHTLGIEVPIAAVALGATVIEKHFTLDKNMPGPDHLASLNPQELTEMVTAIRRIELAMGDGIKRPNSSEQVTKTVVRKRLTAIKNLPIGHVLNPSDIEFKRANVGIYVEHLDLVIGKKLIQPVLIDTAFQWSDLMQVETAGANDSALALAEANVFPRQNQ